MLNEIGYLVIVAFLWGATNPLIKKGSTGICKVKSDSLFKQFFLELKYLVTNVQYVVPMVLNQLGSVIYFLTLQSVNLSLAVPVANSLTFVFTALSGWILKEQTPTRHTFTGIVLILIGTSLCCYDSYKLTISKEK